MLDADQSPNAVSVHAGTSRVDFEFDCPPPACLSTRRSFDHHGKGNGNFVEKRVSKNEKKSYLSLICSFPMKTQLFFFQSLGWFRGEAKTPKIIGCCRAIFAFLPALKMGTFLGKWTLEWVFIISLFVQLALYFLNQQQTCFFFDCFLTMPNRNCKDMFDLERWTVQKITFCLSGWKPI